MIRNKIIGAALATSLALAGCSSESHTATTADPCIEVLGIVDGEQVREPNYDNVPEISEGMSPIEAYAFGAAALMSCGVVGDLGTAEELATVRSKNPEEYDRGAAAGREFIAEYEYSRADE